MVIVNSTKENVGILRICIEQKEFLLSNDVLLKTPVMVPFVAAFNDVCTQSFDNAKTNDNILFYIQCTMHLIAVVCNLGFHVCTSLYTNQLQLCYLIQMLKVINKGTRVKLLSAKVFNCLLVSTCWSLLFTGAKFP